MYYTFQNLTKYTIKGTLWPKSKIEQLIQQCIWFVSKLLHWSEWISQATEITHWMRIFFRYSDIHPYTQKKNIHFVCRWCV